MAGGKNSRTIFDAPDLTSFDGVVNLKLTYMEKIKEDYVWLRYQVMNGKADKNAYGGLNFINSYFMDIKPKNVLPMKGLF